MGEETPKSIVEETPKSIVEEIPKSIVELTSAVDQIEPRSAVHSSTVVVREAQGPCLPSKSASSTAPVESAPKRRCFAGPLPLEAFDVEQVSLAEVHEEKEETGQEEGEVSSISATCLGYCSINSNIQDETHPPSVFLK